MFCRLTGYAEGEVLGRNCRFLQSPTGQVGRGEVRRYTSEGAVAYLKRQLAADKECQTRIVNYRKGGAPFVNLLTVIPVPPPLGWEDGEEVVYHVGFQVDLSEQNVWRMQQHQQPHVLLLPPPPPVVPPVQLGQLGLGLGLGPSGATSMKKLSAVGHQPFISKTLKKLLADTEFVRSIPISSATTVPVAGCGGTAAAATTTTTTTTTTTAVVVVDSSSSSTKANNSASEGGGDRSSSSSSWLSLMLLETCPDFVHVVSLKGSFLYVGPSVRRVLGYEPEEMVGGSIADLAHPEDVVPLMRELKESSSTGGGGGGGGGVGASTLLFGQEEQTHASMAPRTVDLLFRARTKGGVYVWVECRGRLFVEPGKGRKAIILSGRAREMPRLGWETVCMRPFWGRREFWCLVGGQGTFVAVGSGVKEVLGWNGCELVGRRVGSVVEEWRDEEGSWPGTTTTTTMSRLRRADGGSELGRVVVYHSLLSKSQTNSSISPWPLICQIQLGDGSGRVLPPPPPLLQREGNVFAELETSRGSSWQYELQQLRFANQRLGEAVRRVGPVSMKRSWESMVTTT
ncbi:hypothetical protein APHAL10511_003476 [Amanita phalloides]|nr:hypothetical protein APHAL10511_003476 [Amanita phalloides]